MNSENNLVNEQLSVDKKFKEVTKYKGAFRIFGVIRNSNRNKSSDSIDGFVVMSEKTMQFKTFSYEQTKIIIKQFPFSNAEIASDGTIKCTECSINRLPVFDENLRLTGYKTAMMIIGKIVSGDKVSGYRVINHIGKVADFSERDIIRLASNNECNLLVNAKIVTRDNNIFISAIQNDFTIIQKTFCDNEQRIKELTQLSKGDVYRRNGKIAKLSDKWTYQVLKMGLGLKCLAYTYFPMTLVKFSDSDNIEFQKLAKVYMNEVLDYTKITSDKDKEIFKKLKATIGADNFKYKVIPKESANNLNILKTLAFAMCQFALYDDLVYTKLMETKLKTKNISLDMAENLEDKMLYTDILAKFIKEKYDLTNNKRGSRPKEFKEFNQSTFVNTKEIANIGFAIHENNEGAEWKNPYGYTYSLNYIGKYIDNFDEYKAMSTTFGDMGVIAQIKKTLTCNYFDEDETWQRVEIMLAIMSFYRPDIAKKFINENSARFPVLADMLPELSLNENEGRVDYGLSPELEIYYSSAFNVFLNDNGYNVNGVESRRRYYREYLKNSKYINYRGLGTAYRVNHPLLYNELAPIVNMITSSRCNIDTIENLIGVLRVL